MKREEDWQKKALAQSSQCSAYAKQSHVPQSEQCACAPAERLHTAPERIFQPLYLN
jgi:hypothetical protein